MKKKIITVFILLSIIASGCVTVNVYQHPVKQYQNNTDHDSTDCNSRWLFQN